MSQSKILLGKLNDASSGIAGGENIWLEKHNWSCDWYWGFGYVGNRNCHFHIDSLVKGNATTASELFKTTKFTDAQWWVMRDLIIQAYALKTAAEVYRYGGHQTTQAGCTDLIRDAEMTTRLNADLKIILDKMWDFACSAIGEY